jgi:hypothetical protein
MAVDAAYTHYFERQIVGVQQLIVVAVYIDIRRVWIEFVFKKHHPVIVHEKSTI